jgi:arsenite methyltransferase
MARHFVLTTYEREHGSLSWKEVIMSDSRLTEPSLDLGRLRLAIQEEYAAVARDPGRGYHFHTGRPLASMLGYRDDWLEGVPEGSIASFAGTGNPFRIGQLQPGERVVDVGSGAGIDRLAESLPVPDSWADVAISNGVLNLLPDKLAALQEIARVLKPTGRLQVADILVQQTVPEDAKQQIDLWTG